MSRRVGTSMYRRSIPVRTRLAGWLLSRDRGTLASVLRWKGPWPVSVLFKLAGWLMFGRRVGASALWWWRRSDSLLVGYKLAGWQMLRSRDVFSSALKWGIRPGLAGWLMYKYRGVSASAPWWKRLEEWLRIFGNICWWRVRWGTLTEAEKVGCSAGCSDLAMRSASNLLKRLVHFLSSSSYLESSTDLSVDFFDFEDAGLSFLTFFSGTAGDGDEAVAEADTVPRVDKSTVLRRCHFHFLSLSFLLF